MKGVAGASRIALALAALAIACAGPRLSSESADGWALGSADTLYTLG